MIFKQETLLERLEELSSVGGKPSRIVVAFSGGLDSIVLAHAVIASRSEHGAAVVLVYVDHGLQQDSSLWLEHCQSFAETHNVDFISRRVSVDLDSGLGLEAAAREARYSTLRNLLLPGDWLLSAHHQDDQAETLLLNLMRGSGPAGLAGIAAIRKFAAGWLVRPLLDMPRRALEDYAESHSLDWIKDPSNLDQQFDRNYLRHEVLPLFEARWPDAARRVRRSATLAGEAAALLKELALLDAKRLGERIDRLSVAGLRELAPPRQRNLLRYAILQLGLPMPGAVHLEKIQTELIAARDDAQPVVAWSGARARRHRDRLYLLAADDFEMPAAVEQQIVAERVELPAGLGTLVFEHGAVHGLADAVMERGLELRYRAGGEEILPYGQVHTRKLKKLLQEESVVPWMRNRIPLLYSGGELVAVADLWFAATAVSEPGVAVHWQNRPAIH